MAFLEFIYLIGLGNIHWSRLCWSDLGDKSWKHWIRLLASQGSDCHLLCDQSGREFKKRIGEESRIYYVMKMLNILAYPKTEQEEAPEFMNLIFCWCMEVSKLKNLVLSVIIWGLLFPESVSPPWKERRLHYYRSSLVKHSECIYRLLVVEICLFRYMFLLQICARIW